MRYLLFVLLLAGCSTYKNNSKQTVFLSTKPIVQILPMEDRTQNLISTQSIELFTASVFKRIDQKQRLAMAPKKGKGKQFVVSMELIQMQESVQNPAELSLGVHLKILDLRADKPQIILQEILSLNTLLEKPLNPDTMPSWKEKAFRVSPLGLAHAKLSRDIAMRIEDYILLATKG